MRTKIFIFLAVIILSVGLHAQEIDFNEHKKECGTYFESKDTVHLPHFGQNLILDQILDITMKRQSALKSSTVGLLADNIPFHIPVKIWVYRNNDGSAEALSEANARRLFDEVNRHFAVNNTGIQFYLKCGITYVNSTKFNTIDSDNEYMDMIETYHEPYAHNWHLVHSTTTDWGGKARFPWYSPNFCFCVEFGGTLPDSRILTTVHEIGHTLGLLHTHENTRGTGNYNGDAANCFQESVSRTRTQAIGCLFSVGSKKCEINGDALCDTEAAPNEDSYRFIRVDNSTNCNYIGIINSDGTSYKNVGTDNWGDTWNPPTRNIMSYVYAGTCRSEFTSGQIAVMHMTIMEYMAIYTVIYIPLPVVLGYVPWYNLHSITLSGTVNSGENETFIVPRRIVLAPGSNTYTIKPGASVDLFAGESIDMNHGFHAESGSVFSSNVGNLTGCSTIIPGMGLRGGSLSITEGSLTQEDIDECISIIKKALNREYWNLENKNDDVITEKEKAKFFTFSIFPNPANDFVTIDYTLHVDATICIELYNLFGQRLKLILPEQNQKAGGYSVEAFVSDLGSGACIIKLSSGDQSESKQLIINQ